MRTAFVLLFAAAAASALQEVPQHDAYHQGHGFGGMDVDVPISSPQVVMLASQYNCRCTLHRDRAAETEPVHRCACTRLEPRFINGALLGGVDRIWSLRRVSRAAGQWLVLSGVRQ